jgi:flagellar hook-associated protein 3 FlgL
MSSIPSNLARVSNLLSSQIILGSLTRSQQELLRMQVQLSTGKLVNRPSDDSVAASTISVLDDVLERRHQRLRNLSHGEAVLNNLDAALADASELALEAKSIGSSQIGVGSDADTRDNQAQVVDALLRQLTSISNRQYQQLFLFSGGATARPAMTELLGGLRYGGEGDGLTTDTGFGQAVPITMPATTAFGTLSSRVEGDRDLDPILTANARLLDLNGARGFGIGLGAINIDVNGTDLTVDLSGAHTIQDVIDALNTEIQTVDAGALVQIDAATNNRLEIIPSGGVTITIADLSTPATAADLGLTGTYTGPGGGTGADLDPRLTETTLISSLTGVTLPLGTIRLTNAGQSRDLDLSGTTTIRDVMNAVEGLNLGIRVAIAPGGDRLDVVNELSGGSMSIAEVAGGSTATELGVRSLAGSTLLSDFNNGRGVQVVDGSVDPITGLPDPARDIDFRITTKDGTQIDVDLSDEATVQDVLDAINAAAALAGLTVGTDFEARLATDGNGLEFEDNTSGGVGTTLIESLNGSYAAADLGIEGSTTSAVLTGEDRATVAVDSLFTHLMALRDALRANDERGISLATEQFEADISRLAQARAEVGVRSRRLADASLREEDLRLQDTALRSQVQDLEYTEAAVRFASLQQQLQAGLTTAAQVNRLSLLDFLR